MFPVVTCNLDAGPAPGTSRLIVDGPWVWTQRPEAWGPAEEATGATW